jgi:hypothetical protein
MTGHPVPVSTSLDYTTQPGGFDRIEVGEAARFLRDDCPYCGGDAKRQYYDYDIYGGKHLAYVVSPCERCGWWIALKFWEGSGNVIHAAAVSKPIVRAFALDAEDVDVCNVLQALMNDPRRTSELASERFERLVEQYLRDQGSAVDDVSRVRSSGGDLVALDRSGNRFLVEAKHWKDKVGIDVIWKLVGAMWEHRYEVGMLFTSGNFTRDARQSEAVTSRMIALRDFDDLAAWLGVKRERRGTVSDLCQTYCYGDAMSEL